MIPLRTILPRFRRTIFVALLSVSAVGASACGSDELTGPESLVLARTRWSDRGPSSYTMTIERACECLAEMMGPVDVTVHNGVVTSRKYTSTGLDVSTQYASAFPAVEGLFQIVDDALRQKVQPVEFKYDASLGFPTRIVLGNPAADGPITSVSNLRAQ